MGYAIAEAAHRRGAAVTLVSGPVNISAPAGVDVVRVDSTAELHAEVTARAAGFDVVIQAAAPSDFRPIEIAKNKIKRTGDALEIKLVPNPDIAAQLGRDKKPGQVLVAFAAETENLIENAREKLRRKNADLVVANDVTVSGAGFGSDDNCVVLITESAVTELPLMPKRAVAEAILDAVTAILKDADKK
jgi:phosphopantothenoylcysteine decarboxylase/phosphopantothenate--cysteine ligase